MSDQEHPNASLLRVLYTDLTRIVDYAADDIIYHLAARDSKYGAPNVQGKQAALAEEQKLAELTGGTLVAEVDHVVANDYFGAVMGIFRAHIGESEMSFPFCGLWRFKDGLITDHWQNAYDPNLLVEIALAADGS